MVALTRGTGRVVAAVTAGAVAGAVLGLAAVQLRQASVVCAQQGGALLWPVGPCVDRGPHSIPIGLQP